MHRPPHAPAQGSLDLLAEALTLIYRLSEALRVNLSGLSPAAAITAQELILQSQLFLRRHDRR